MVSKSGVVRMGQSLAEVVRIGTLLGSCWTADYVPLDKGGGVQIHLDRACTVATDMAGVRMCTCGT